MDNVSLNNVWSIFKSPWLYMAEPVCAMVFVNTDPLTLSVL